MTQKALTGIKVLEWAQLVSGPYCSKLLADLGAEVIKLEEPGKGDEARRREPFLNDIPHPERSGLFLYLNTNKLGITLDVKNPAGKKIFKQLVKQTDILIEDNPPRMIEELGLTYEELKEVNPGLIMISITPFGQTGHYRDYKAYPLNTFHSGGEGYIMPSPSPSLDREPVKMGKFAGEYACGIVGAGAIICALLGREMIGSGQHIDISKQDALIYLANWDLLKYARFGRLTTRMTSFLPFEGTFQCKDGYIVFQPVTQDTLKQWAYFYQAIIYPDVDERLNDPNYVWEHRKELSSLRDEKLKQMTREEFYSAPPAKHCILAPFYKLDEVVESPQIKERGFFVESDHSEAGRLSYPSAPYQFSKTLWSIERPAPLLGEHNEEVYTHRLGYSKQDMVKLHEGRVI